MLKKGDTRKPWTKASIRRRYFMLDGTELSYYRSQQDLHNDGSHMKVGTKTKQGGGSNAILMLCCTMPSFQNSKRQVV